MKILSIECSAQPCSVAIMDDQKILASSFVNVKLTHSQTLLPMVENLLNAASIPLSEIEGFAISAGPGSFTGVRIGISAIKGLASPKNIPCVGVSTLLSMAESFRDTDCIVCAVMDARCNQVYNALFEIKNGEITRLCDDRALLCPELAKEISELSQKLNLPIIITGDGTEVFYPYVETLDLIKKSDIQRRYQTAIGVGLAAMPHFISGNTLSAEELLPVYLRLPQAERELMQKKGNEK